MAEVDKSEKITINVGLVDLGQIDLLVDEGFYANRTDFIRTAIRRQLESRAEAVNDTVARRALTLGTQHLSRRDLEELRDAGQTVDLHVLGLATIANDVSPDLALATISSVEVLGAFRAPRDRQGRPRHPHHLSCQTAPTDRSTSRHHTPKGLPWTTYRSTGMSEALRLTRAGQLTEAFAVLQRTLGAARPAATSRVEATGGQHTPPTGWRTMRRPGGLLGRLRRTRTPRTPAPLRRPPHPAARSATWTTPTQPGPEAMTSTSRPATPVRRCRWSSCCTAASRTPPTSPQAPG